MYLLLQQTLTWINELVTLSIIFPTMLLFGLFLTVKLKGFQVTKLKQSWYLLLHQKKSDVGNISHFEAISTVLAGNFGTGNISGMAVALTTGGPGALVWMWFMVFFGAAIQYASCVLGVKYRQKNKEGEYVGGPMYYLSTGLKQTRLAQLFCVLTVFAAISVGNFAQINSMTLPLTTLGFDPLISGCVIAFFVGLVLLGGIQRIAKIASMIVPLKAALYIGFALTIILLNSEHVLPALKLMFNSAFDFRAAGGGVLGAAVFTAITTGFNRSIFATDAGTGIVPILQSSARTSNPIEDGLVTLVAPFMVMVVCTLTGLVLIVTDAWLQPGLQSTNMVTYAFSQGLGHEAGKYVVMLCLILFGYTTILAWCYCAEKAVAYLFGTRSIKWFSYFYIALIPVGAVVEVNFVWLLADICITAMLIVNLIGIIGLSKEVITSSRIYFNEN